VEGLVTQMDRAAIVNICDREALDTAAQLFQTRKESLKKFADYEGAANLVYEYQLDGKPFVLRLTFTSERTKALIQAELEFVNYLAAKGVGVSKPVSSIHGALVETIQAESIAFQVVSFAKGKGMRVPDNGYQYRSDAPIEEYFQNWGAVLGQMHALTEAYQPSSSAIQRPDWFELHRKKLSVVDQLPKTLQPVREQIHTILAELRSFPKEGGSYGLIHGDFNDGNFTVDYANGDITVFDFDDSCYFWFVYELASAWEGGVGRVMFRDLEERKSFMDHYMEQVMVGYQRHHEPPPGWKDQLEFFIRLIQIEAFLHYARYIDDEDPEMIARINYMTRCIEDQIPYMGFFDRLYSPVKPFQM
jgi:Ser/Thr protein kinase RdoA (MazF antagonist)